jgi:PiT family inorganic phosphate transporter
MNVALLLAVTLALAAANGANDNFKGAATLLGSGLTDYRRALLLATVATAAGALASILISGGLIASFGGRGIVPEAVAASPAFLCSVGAAAAITVGLATRFGFPVSTTHALVGGLLGAGLASTAGAVDPPAALRALLAPLLLSPLIAIALSLALVPLLRRVRRAAEVAPAPCACVVAAPAADASAVALHIVVADSADARCAPAVAERALVLQPVRTLDSLHYLSAAAVGFARGLNDTPKIAALLVAAGTLSAAGSSLAVATAMALGGWFAARRVGLKMAHGITRMDPAEGLAGNLVTSLLVVGASRFGLPVSTTHVSCGALFGIAAGNGRGRMSTIVSIVLAWLTTLPLAALLGYALHVALLQAAGRP